MAVHRPAVRIVCVDSQQRVLLLRWQDPFDGHHLWEPPGGGVEAGESYLDTARRELLEETGLSGETIIARPVLVARDIRWNGVHYQGHEAFFLARFDLTPVVSRDGLLEHETQTLQDYRWVPWRELGDLTDPLEPPHLREVLADLDPAGPWAAP